MEPLIAKVAIFGPKGLSDWEPLRKAHLREHKFAVCVAGYFASHGHKLDASLINEVNNQVLHLRLTHYLYCSQMTVHSNFLTNLHGQLANCHLDLLLDRSLGCLSYDLGSLCLCIKTNMFGWLAWFHWKTIACMSLSANCLALWSRLDNCCLLYLLVYYLVVECSWVLLSLAVVNFANWPDSHTLARS